MTPSPDIILDVLIGEGCCVRVQQAQLRGQSEDGCMLFIANKPRKLVMLEFALWGAKLLLKLCLLMEKPEKAISTNRRAP